MSGVSRLRSRCQFGGLISNFDPIMEHWERRMMVLKAT